jgi:nucleoside-diphosphate-sugar epimerase
MRRALVGHTGFVGGNLAAQASFDARFNSRNIEEIAGCQFDQLVISAMPAAKWIANANPANDREILDRLSGCLRKASAKQVVVISTVDVYPNPVEVDEDTRIDVAAQQAYGKHRLLLEQQMAEHFPNVLVVRLPGLFGPGLRKNAIYDLLHDNNVDKVNANGVFQFYNVARLWRDIRVVIDAGLCLINFTSPPLSIRDMAREAFGVAFDHDPGGQPAKYDVRSKHAALFDGRDGYLFDRDSVLRDMRDFVARERKALP